jgi:hypothetical protein
MRLAYGAAVFVAIIVGSALRLVPIGLPFFIVKYVGSAIWGAMVFAVVAFCVPFARLRTIILIALAIALLSEFFRLYQAPELDAFRRTLPGQLLLGRIFSIWNIAAYGAGIMLASAADRSFRRSRAQALQLPGHSSHQ